MRAVIDKYLNPLPLEISISLKRSSSIISNVFAIHLEGRMGN